MVISAAAIFITAVISTILCYQVLKKQVFEDLSTYAYVLSQNKVEDLNIRNDALRVTVVDADGGVVYDSKADITGMENHKKRPEVKVAMKKGKGTSIRWSSTSSEHTFYYAQKLSDGNILRVSKQTSSIYQVITSAAIIILSISLTTFICCALVAHLLTRRMVEPIERMAENLVMLDESNVYEEIRPFVTTIKEQHVNILKHAKIRQDFTANVSHELKTPLTAISGYAELIENGMVDQEDTKRFAIQIGKNSNRLLRLINDIIELSELDDLHKEIPFESFNLYEAAQNCLSMTEIQAEKQEVECILTGEEVMVNANRDLVEELIYNLCSNAVRYNKRNGKVIVFTGNIEGQPVLRVEDTGIGIPKEHQGRIFERFYRVDKSRSKSTGGTGLGLAIVKHIVAQHDATIELESEEGNGTKITVRFRS